MRRIFVAAALFLGAMTLTLANAQTGGQAGQMMGMMGGGCPMMGMMGQGMMGQGMMGDRHVRMGAMAEGRLAYLKSALTITEAQSEVWNAYADAVRGRVETMQGMRQAMMEAMQAGSAIDRMDARIAGMQAMLEAMSAVKPATEKLYAVLSGEQKKIADQLIGFDCGAM